jgi:hypothetical protein
MCTLVGYLIHKEGFFLFIYITLLHSTVSEDAGIEPRTIVTLVLTTRRFNHSATYHLYLTHTCLPYFSFIFPMFRMVPRNSQCYHFLHISLHCYLCLTTFIFSLILDLLLTSMTLTNFQMSGNLFDLSLVAFCTYAMCNLNYFGHHTVPLLFIFYNIYSPFQILNGGGSLQVDQRNERLAVQVPEILS